MEKTLEWERKQRENKRLKIMRLRFPTNIIEELIEKGIAWFNDDYIFSQKKSKNETKWGTQNYSDGGT